MKTLTLRTFENKLTSAQLLIAALSYPGREGYTYAEAAVRTPLIDKLRAAEDGKSVDFEDAEFSRVKSLFEKCPFTHPGSMAEVVAVGRDLEAAQAGPAPGKKK